MGLYPCWYWSGVLVKTGKYMYREGDEEKLLDDNGFACNDSSEVDLDLVVSFIEQSIAYGRSSKESNRDMCEQTNAEYIRQEVAQYPFM